MARFGKIAQTRSISNSAFTVDDPNLVVYGPGGAEMDIEEALVKDQYERDELGLPTRHRIPRETVERVNQQIRDRG